MNPLVLACIALVTLTSPTPEGSPVDELLDAGDTQAALDLAERIVDADPGNALGRFELVRAHAAAGDQERAVQALRAALERGFVDLHRLRRDPLLEEVRASRLAQQVLSSDGWRTRLDTRGRLEAEALHRALGEDYVLEQDDKLRFSIIHAREDELFEIAQEEIARVAAFAGRLFPAAPESRQFPDPWTIVLLASPEDAERFLPGEGVGGLYDHARKAVVVRDLGPSLRHEIFHALHWRHIERTGQQHPIWIREGLAALVEDIASDAQDDPDADQLRVLPSWRTNIAKRLAQVRRLRPWPSFVDLSPERFVGTRPRSNYAQARALFHWLWDSGELENWLAAYHEGYDADPTGLTAVGQVLGQEEREWSKGLREWLADQPEVGVPGRRRPIGLGVAMRPGDGDGPVVDASPFTRDHDLLRVRDVIRAIDGEPVRTLSELYRVLGGYKEGQSIELTVVRAGRQRVVRVQTVREMDALSF